MIQSLKAVDGAAADAEGGAGIAEARVAVGGIIGSPELVEAVMASGQAAQPIPAVLDAVAHDVVVVDSLFNACSFGDDACERI